MLYTLNHPKPLNPKPMFLCLYYPHFFWVAPPGHRHELWRQSPCRSGSPQHNAGAFINGLGSLLKGSVKRVSSLGGLGSSQDVVCGFTAENAGFTFRA